MPDITELLESTTPADVPPVDLTDLARRARNRRRRQRAASASAVLLVITALAAAILTRPGDDPDVTVGPGPSTDLTEPVGTWIDAADPPFDPDTDAFTATLTDGRVLVWEPSGGGIYSPSDDRWKEIPLAPFEQVDDYTVQIVQDRLAVVTIDTSTGRPDQVAVYDVDTNVWRMAPTPPIPVQAYTNFHVAWNGETLALVHARQDASDAPSTTVRWQFREDSWSSGSPIPLTERSLPGAASDGGRLAIWGGSATADGAIYNIGQDHWETIPPAPISGRSEPLMMWWRGRLLVGGGEGTDLGADERDDLVAFDPSGNGWAELPPAPDVGNIDAGSSPYGETDDSNGFLTSPLGGGSFDGAAGYWFFDGQAWHVGEFHDLHDAGNLVVATSRGTSDDVPMRFQVQVHVDGDEWAEAAEAPEGLSPDPIVATSGSKLVVVDPSGTWVLDLEG